MVKLSAVVVLGSLLGVSIAHSQYRRDIQDYEEEALREFYEEYADILEREPLGFGGAMAGVSMGGNILGNILGAIGQVVPGKAGNGLQKAGQAVAGVTKAIAGRSDIPGEYDARNFEEELEEREFLDFDDLDERELGWEDALDVLD